MIARIRVAGPTTVTFVPTGTRLFERPPAEQVELEQVDSVTTPHATHLTYRLGARRRH